MVYENYVTEMAGIAKLQYGSCGADGPLLKWWDPLYAMPQDQLNAPFL